MEETVGKSSTSRLQIYPSPSDAISPYLRGEENFAFLSLSKDPWFLYILSLVWHAMKVANDLNSTWNSA
jgi:hypothetical protein